MHPARSVIFFTAATGAGYGLLALLGLFAVLGLLPARLGVGLASMGLALGLITAGLVSSTGHLTHPERAWRAFSQWRSSWLSREGVAAVFTYMPASLFAIGWVFFGRTDGWVAAAGIVAGVGAVITICMTGMIYASLKPVAQWHTPFTLPSYVLYAAMTGLSLLTAILESFGLAAPWLPIAAAILTLGGWVWKSATWRHNGRLSGVSSANAATALRDGRVQSVQWPHSARNYLLKEMGFRVARKHARRLRALTQILAFALPTTMVTAAVILHPPYGGILYVLAEVVQFSGMLIERWLFFAEATHTVTLYYGISPSNSNS